MGLSGADIADRLRAHMLSQNILSNTTNSEFLSNLTPQTLEFFNQSSPNGKMANRPNNGQLNPAYGSNNGLQGDAGLNTPNNPSGKPSVECEICHKKFSSKKNLASHTKNNHSQHENEITAKSKEHVREIFDAITIRGQLISERNFGVFKSPKKQKQIFEGFLT